MIYALNVPPPLPVIMFHSASPDGSELIRPITAPAV